MQSKKASNKTNKNAEETLSANLENKAAAETSAQPRTIRSSKPKSESGEKAAAKRHRAATPAVSSESPAVVEAAPKTMAAAAGQISGFAVSSIVDPVGVETATITPVAAVNGESTPTATISVTEDRIAELAHSYWLARGEHGSHEEDWLRAERELKNRR